MVRIHLNLAPASVGPSSSKRRRLNGAGVDPDQGSSAASSSVPRPLLALSPNGELVLIELQGSLEMEDQGGAEGESSTIGELIWGEGREDKPTLVLSHHRLEGKLATLSKPLAVIEKRKRVDQEEEDVDREDGRDGGVGEAPKNNGHGAAGDAASGPLSSSSTTIHASKEEEEARRLPTAAADDDEDDALRLSALLADSDDEDNRDARIKRQRHADPVSPTAERRGKLGGKTSIRNGELGRPPASNRSEPAVRAGAERQGEEQTAMPQTTDPRSSPPLRSSSPAPVPAPLHLGSSIDYSSPPATPQRAAPEHRANDDDEDEGDRTITAPPTASVPNGNKAADLTSRARRTRQTATYYDVVCIIRKKVLFSKRPEPLVHGVGDGARLC
ncbi:hypothetical protein BDZ90DRAFT_163504 [Jaminaea rosea]|uniref:Uncharacterized protein n=1 Tax=Jaminaea rosea TaxID=1569628 RepID=A0A316US45_9BASI|nr:hypothetical protein BDZ90DRAFT_163504 [Jaminaea rosea]PWN28140.1 hypothetical protein BDZ90DRAFT_163504 [Jaminaea rosea]